ncbi:Chaperonin GroEL (HSP60 family) [Haloarcula vallismortis]|uniref:Thermosome alpha subunit n=2 Tax=Haloarcula vallismortis TaxID=28442 RepID=M0J6M6_HALVA|nr:TCP-1/cpn60 chaperonin family protein [Haloarcula vallismortis]EMA04616.1 thermosome alpha subunit [Haloarcula vallismortis ATCC 29715]SDX15983.1 Chaperonin GroEL (HSP60 family) [Haloarcula vallismortis]
MLGDTTGDVDGDSDTSERNDTQTPAGELADTIRTTLGPNGLDKMVVGENGTVIVSNDGSSIVEWMDITHPVGRLVERAAAAQDSAVGDGTTTAVVLVGALLDEAATLRSDGLHPTTIVDGYVKAAEAALDQFGQYERGLDCRHDDRLTQIAKTAVTGRWDDVSTDRFAELTLNALEAVEFDTSKLTLRSYHGGELRESACLDGVVVDLKSSSTALEALHPRAETDDEPAVAMVDGEIGIEESDRVQSVEVRDTTQRSALQDYERERKTDLVEQVVQSGATVIICQKSIDEAVRTALAQRGVLPVERTRRDEFDVIARATGSTPVMSVDELTEDDTGTVESVTRRTVGTTQTLVLQGCPEEQRRTVLLRGGTPHVAEEVRRIVTDCIDVIRGTLDGGTFVPGGGAVPAALAMELAALSSGIPDRTQLVFDGFGTALESLPRTLASNAGTDPLDTLTAIRQRHDAGSETVGVGPDGNPRDMIVAGVLEPSMVFKSALQRAVAVVTQILRVDDIVRTSAGERGADGEHDHAHTATGGYPWAVGH